MSDEDKPTRRIVDQKPVIVVPTVDRLMNDALSIIGSELAAYKSKTQKGMRLDAKEARSVQNYMDALVKLNREMREAARMHDLSNLSDEELSKLAHEVLNRDVKPKVITSNRSQSKDDQDE
jgi:ribosome-binding ATPase YchF (GTP1/OBG family)